MDTPGESEVNREHDALFTRIAALARTLRGADQAGTRTFTAVLAAAASQTVTLVPGVDHAAIALVAVDKRGPGAGDLQYATDEVAEELTRVQLDTARGPAVQTARDVVVTDLTGDEVGPVGSAARRLGVGAMMTMPLFVDARSVGVLTAYATEPAMFDDDAVATGAAIATHVALAALSLGEDASMRTALASRDVIGQAKGILMERHDLDAAAAFDLLARTSQLDNRRLVSIAADVVATRRPPPGEHGESGARGNGVESRRSDRSPVDSGTGRSLRGVGLGSADTINDGR